ncbi:MAG: hypothetical protein AAGK09_14970 [Planctomycetota bacterium]
MSYNTVVYFLAHSIDLGAYAKTPISELLMGHLILLLIPAMAYVGIRLWSDFRLEKREKLLHGVVFYAILAMVFLIFRVDTLFRTWATAVHELSWAIFFLMLCGMTAYRSLKKRGLKSVRNDLNSIPQAPAI